MSPRTYNKKKTQNKKIEIKELTCVMCGNTQKPNMHYQSFNPLHATGYLPYCKSCLKNMCFDTNGILHVEKVKEMLQLIDRPFIYDLFKISAENNGDIIGNYIKNIAMPQYKKLGWKNSIFEPQAINVHANNLIYEEKSSNFVLTNEIIERWRDHNPSDIVYLEEFYQRMKNDNKIESVQDEIYLKKLAFINLEQDKAGKREDWQSYDKLGSMFSKFMQDAKLRAQDRTEADRTGGLRNFSSIYAEVEKDDFIPPWEYYRKINGAVQDIVDKTIMHMENFILRLNRVERMTVPPNDTPKLMSEEIDNNALSNYTEVNIDISEDLIETKKDGE